MAMLGSPCSPCCCPSGGCPDYSVFESAETLHASVSYSYGFASPVAQIIRTIAFSGTYALSKDAAGWSSDFIQVDGVGNWRLRVFLVSDSFSNSTGLRFSCVRSQNQNFLTPGSVGSIGFEEMPCSGDLPVARAIGRYSLLPVFNMGVGNALHEYLYLRDGGLSFSGQIVLFNDNFRPVNIGINPLHRLINTCLDGSVAGRGEIRDETPPAQVIEYNFLNEVEAQQYIVSESLTVASLDANFGSFNQNMLMSVCDRYWANQLGTQEEVKIEGDSQTPYSESFSGQNSRCSQLTPP